jgi:heat shock protein HslJ
MIRRTAIFVLTLGLGGCVSLGGGSSEVVLEGTLWRLVRIDEQPIAASPDARVWPQLRITSADAVVRGATGCNTFSGPYRADGTRVGFGPLAVTEAACADAPLADQERRILDILTNADGYRIRGRTLSVMIQGRPRMRFEVWR